MGGAVSRSAADAGVAGFGAATAGNDSGLIPENVARGRERPGSFSIFAGGDASAIAARAEPAAPISVCFVALESFGLAAGALERLFASPGVERVDSAAGGFAADCAAVAVCEGLAATDVAAGAVSAAKSSALVPENVARGERGGCSRGPVSMVGVAGRGEAAATAVEGGDTASFVVADAAFGTRLPSLSVDALATFFDSLDAEEFGSAAVGFAAGCAVVAACEESAATDFAAGAAPAPAKSSALVPENVARGERGGCT